MNKSQYIQESYIKEVLEQEEQNENEFYAEQYLSDLKEQHKDAEVSKPQDIVLLAMERVARITPFATGIKDLNIEIEILKEIKLKLNYYEYQTPYTESVKAIFNILDRGMEDLRDEIGIQNFEIEQIVEMG